MIVQISGSIEIDLDDPSGSGSVEADFESAINAVAEEWGLVRSNSVQVLVTEEDDDPQPGDDDA